MSLKDRNSRDWDLMATAVVAAFIGFAVVGLAIIWWSNRG